MEKRKFRIISLLADIAILAISFLIMAAIKPSGLRAYVPSHSIFFGVLVVLWLLGLITSYTLGGGIHVLLVIAIIAIIVWLVIGRRHG